MTKCNTVVKKSLVLDHMRGSEARMALQSWPTLRLGVRGAGILHPLPPLYMVGLGWGRPQEGQMLDEAAPFRAGRNLGRGHSVYLGFKAQLCNLLVM